MFPSGASGNPDLTRKVEEKLKNWQAALARAAPPPVARRKKETAEFVTVSRMVGTDGQAFAAALGERLGWPVFDREILHVMAGDDNVREKVYETLDERDIGWIEDMLRWLVEKGLDKEHYFRRLSETILALARQGPAIFLGRGADLILPRDRGLRVRLVAPLEFRVHCIALREHLTEIAARTRVDRVQSERHDFLRTHFGPRADDLARNDLTINVAKIPASQAVELVAMVLRLHGVVR